ncbi:uncharacterized protein LOC106082700 [Stomoxys calcitrans]|uniref:uncharacterized protein LOC106082700 n=1 Tax=Stomoxys calcitrans TaxID=35570 RepID=UPI0027E26BA9|nr:uncharacterized protein LOC106082700 [Stomoxys calcitrans]
MRSFVLFCSLIALTLAKPQYHYGTGVSGTFGTTSTSSGVTTNKVLTAPVAVSHGHGGGSSLFGESTFGSGNSFGGDSSLTTSSTSGARPSTTFGSGTYGGGIGSGSIQRDSFISGSSSHSTFQGFEAPLVHKHFITISAPEDNDSLQASKNLVIGRPQKNYRVIFIKAPSSSNANVKLSAQYAPQEEKTVIYVLSKNENSLEVSDIATPAPTVPSKPEVHFIKYKTEEEALHAQKQIQAEYDKIEGSSEHTDAGIAPIESVIGVLGNSGGVSGATGSFSSESTLSTVSSSGGLHLGGLSGSTHTGGSGSTTVSGGSGQGTTFGVSIQGTSLTTDDTGHGTILTTTSGGSAHGSTLGGSHSDAITTSVTHHLSGSSSEGAKATAYLPPTV